MKCCECKYYESTWDYNECRLLGFEYFSPYYEEECDYVNSNGTPNREQIEKDLTMLPYSIKFESEE